MHPLTGRGGPRLGPTGGPYPKSRAPARPCHLARRAARRHAVRRDVRWFTDDRLDESRTCSTRRARGAPEGVVAVADEQTAGRGRLGRSWVAPPGASLLVSVLLRPALAARALAFVTMAAGLAAIEAVRELGGNRRRPEVAERRGGRRPQARRASSPRRTATRSWSAWAATCSGTRSPPSSPTIATACNLLHRPCDHA